MGRIQDSGRKARTARWLAPVLVLALWQLAAQAGWLPSRILPAPSDVAAAAAALAQSGELWAHARGSILRALAGLALGGAAGLILGLLFGIWRKSAAQADGFLRAFGLVPVLAFAPLILSWLGADESASLALLSLAAFFPIYIHMQRGIRALDPAWAETGRSCGLRGWPLYLHVILPGALPAILTGLRQGLGLLWMTLAALELFLAPSGLGGLAMGALDPLRTDVLLLAILLYAVLSAGAGVLVGGLERRLLRWNLAGRPDLLSGIH